MPGGSPSYSEHDDANTNRDINTLGLNLLLHPSDRTLSAYLYFNNTIDVFERSEQQFANRTLNTIGFHPQWRWLPQTNVYIDVSQGLNTGIGSSNKVSSLPFTAIAGLQTLFSLKTTFSVRAGYTNGFYSAGPSYSAPVFGADLTHGESCCCSQRPPIAGERAIDECSVELTGVGHRQQLCIGASIPRTRTRRFLGGSPSADATSEGDIQKLLTKRHFREPCEVVRGGW